MNQFVEQTKEYKHLDQVKDIIKSISNLWSDLIIANDHLDSNEATDLVAKEIHFAIRGRKIEYYDKYPNDITIRSKSKYNHKTEYQKIFEEGKADYMFYYFYYNDQIIHWRLIDLNKLRSIYHNNDRYGTKYINLSRSISNNDGTALCPIDLTDIMHIQIATNIKDNQ